MEYRPSHYQSFLLRLWRTEDEAEGSWLAMLEDPHTGERIGFRNVVELQQFLESLVSSKDEGCQTVSLQ
jgi:hypothetical protein